MSLEEWIDKIELWLTPPLSPLDRLKESEKLPFDHPERKLAQELYEQEYGQCNRLEKAFRDKWSKIRGNPYYHCLSFQQIINLANWFCTKCRINKIHGVIESTTPGINSYDILSGMIHITKDADLAVIVHEITHHVHMQNTIARYFDPYHGDEFVRD